MKKILLVLICFFSLPTIVFAEENQEKKYRFYYIEKEYSKEFYEEGKEDKEYPFKTDIFTYSNETKESFDKPEFEDDIIEEIPVVQYQEYEKVKYIMVNDFLSSQSINIQEVEIFAGDDKLDYKFWCANCSNEFIAKVQNNIINFEYNYIKNVEKMIFELEEEYFPDDLKVVFHYGGNYGHDVSFSVRVNNTKNWNDKYYFYQVDLPLSFYVKTEQKLEMLDHEERLSEEVKEIEGNDDIDNAKVISKKIKYKYKIRLYQYYKENRIYVDGYYTDLPGLIKDEDNFIISDKEIPKTITEYIEKEVVVPTTIVEEIPVVEEKTKYLTNTVTEYVEVPKEVSKVKTKEVEVPVKEKDSYLLRYFVYLGFVMGLKKMSIFKV